MSATVASGNDAICEVGTTRGQVSPRHLGAAGTVMALTSSKDPDALGEFGRRPLAPHALGAHGPGQPLNGLVRQGSDMACPYGQNRGPVGVQCRYFLAFLTLERLLFLPVDAASHRTIDHEVVAPIGRSSSAVASRDRRGVPGT